MGQNSTQKPQALQRSTTIETRPFATGSPSSGSVITPRFSVEADYGWNVRGKGVIGVTEWGEETHEVISDTTEVEHLAIVALPSLKRIAAGQVEFDGNNES